MNSLHQAVVGCSKTDLYTPALCLDLDLFDANVQIMVETCQKHGVDWRPHAKCHKSPIIGRWLVDAGAIGLTCATIREAELMAEAEIRDLLIANLIAGPAKIQRLVELASKADPIICLDHQDQADAISQAMATAGVYVRVLIELEIGMNRVGVDDLELVERLAEKVHSLPGLELAGVMAYEGHLLTIEDLQEKEQTIRQALAKAMTARDRLESRGLPCSIVSCGGTGSFPITVKQNGITEIQAGGAIFMDEFYRHSCQIDQLENSLTIMATVVSMPTPDRVVVDTGRKALNIEIYRPRVREPKGLLVESLSAEHGVLRLTEDATPPKIGQPVEIIPGYADLTNVLHPGFLGFRGGKFEREIPIVR
ncbi:MAG: alanine racemase [Planctomycetaceae bacterium]|nr:alanine racemase [Planctomycetaceae bacterium]